MDWIASKKEYTAGEFYRHFSGRLPQLVQITKQYYDVTSKENFCPGQILRIQGISQQRRVLAKFMDERPDVYTLPLDYPIKMALQKKKGKGKKNKGYTVMELLEDNRLPVVVHFAETQNVIVAGNVTCTSRIPDLRLLELHDELYFLVNTVTSGALDPRTSLLAVSDAHLRMCLVEGVQDNTPCLWMALCQTLDRQSRRIEYNYSSGHKDITIYEVRKETPQEDVGQMYANFSEMFPQSPSSDHSKYSPRAQNPQSPLKLNTNVTRNYDGSNIMSPFESSIQNPSQEQIYPLSPPGYPSRETGQRSHQRNQNPFLLNELEGRLNQLSPSTESSSQQFTYDQRAQTEHIDEKRPPGNSGEYMAMDAWQQKPSSEQQKIHNLNNKLNPDVGQLQSHPGILKTTYAKPELYCDYDNTAFAKEQAKQKIPPSTGPKPMRKTGSEPCNMSDMESRDSGLKNKHPISVNTDRDELFSILQKRKEKISLSDIGRSKSDNSAMGTDIAPTVTEVRERANEDSRRKSDKNYFEDDKEEPRPPLPYKISRDSKSSLYANTKGRQDIVNKQTRLARVQPVRALEKMHRIQRVTSDSNPDDGNVIGMASHTLCQWLAKLKLDRHIPAFSRDCIDGNLLLDLDENILKEDFGFTMSEAIKLMKFAREGYVPK